MPFGLVLTDVQNLSSFILFLLFIYLAREVSSNITSLLDHHVFASGQKTQSHLHMFDRTTAKKRPRGFGLVSHVAGQKKGPRRQRSLFRRILGQRLPQ